jgi:hypothetical protein
VKEDKVFQQFTFQRVRFDEKLIGDGVREKQQENKLATLQIVQVKPMSDLFLIRKQGLLMSSWVNCQLELSFPNLKA